MESKMIETLTPDQEKQIPVYFDRWLNMPTKPMDKEIAFSAIERLYKNMGEEKPKIIIGQSPLQTALMVFVCSKLEPLKSSRKKQLESQLGSQLRSQLRSQLLSQLESQLVSQLRSQLVSQLESQLWSQLESQLESQLRS